VTVTAYPTTAQAGTQSITATSFGWTTTDSTAYVGVLLYMEAEYYDSGNVLRHTASLHHWPEIDNPVSWNVLTMRYEVGSTYNVSTDGDTWAKAGALRGDASVKWRWVVEGSLYGTSTSLITAFQYSTWRTVSLP
jgi:hypothetical protein